MRVTTAPSPEEPEGGDPARSVIAEGVAAGGFAWPVPPTAPRVRTSMTCRPSRRRPYWHASLRDPIAGVTHVVHLGRAEKFTPAFLTEKAAALAARVRDWMPGVAKRRGRPRRRRGPGRS